MNYPLDRVIAALRNCSRFWGNHAVKSYSRQRMRLLSIYFTFEVQTYSIPSHIYNFRTHKRHHCYSIMHITFKKRNLSLFNFRTAFSTNFEFLSDPIFDPQPFQTKNVLVWKILVPSWTKTPQALAWRAKLWWHQCLCHILQVGMRRWRQFISHKIVFYIFVSLIVGPCLSSQFKEISIMTKLKLAHNHCDQLSYFISLSITEKILLLIWDPFYVTTKWLLLKRAVGLFNLKACHVQKTCNTYLCWRTYVLTVYDWNDPSALLAVCSRKQSSPGGFFPKHRH